MITVTPGWETPIEGVIWVDKVPKRRSHEVLGTLLRLARQYGANLYALVDSARNDEVFRFLTLDEEEYRSLFRNTRYERLYSVSPFLMTCKRYNKIMDWLTGEVWGERVATYLLSCATFDELFEHFQHLSIVEDDRGVPLFLRLADPLVFHSFITSCTLEERLGFFGPVEVAIVEAGPGGLLYFTKNDSLEDSDKPKCSRSSSRDDRWILSKAQEESLDHLTLECQKRKAFLHFRKSEHRNAVKLDDADLFSFITSCIEKAGSYGIFSDGAIFNFIEAALECGEDFPDRIRNAVLYKLFLKPSLTKDVVIEELQLHLVDNDIEN